jgi:hypothetical protein
VQDADKTEGRDRDLVLGDGGYTVTATCHGAKR